VTEEFADLRQRRALLEHLTSECMPELVSAFARRIDSGPLQRVSDHRANTRLPLETSRGRFGTEENASAADSRAPVPQIVGDRGADILWQRQLGKAASLPAHCYQSFLPIQVLQRKSLDLTGA
jgi:hypothetical protein